MPSGQMPGAGSTFKSIYGPGPTGRPQGRKTSTRPVIALAPHLDQMPIYMKAAKDLMNTYGKSTLPPGLQSRWERNRINRSISTGMTKGK